MNKNKEIIVFTCGDSNDISTWSNVPFLFTTTLEKKGCVVYRVDTSPSKIVNRLFNTISFVLFRKIFKLKACPEFHRTFLHRLIVYRRIKKATKKYKNSVLNLFLTYAFYNKYSNKPSVLWCDWTDRIVIERLGRKPRWYEEASLKHEDNVMKSADVIFSLFPRIAQSMSEYYGREILHLGKNVINTIYDGEFDVSEVIRRRKFSNKILFIGNLRYLGAAQSLLNAYKEYKKENIKAELHVIGMTKEQLKCDEEGVYCYGYLHKNIKVERDLYYSLLLDARVFVNPARVWGGYSSSIEAMYYACPIIVAPYGDFVEEFGENISFGEYLNDDDVLVDKIRGIFDFDRYNDMCLNAHNVVKDYTWDNYVDKFVGVLKSKAIL